MDPHALFQKFVSFTASVHQVTHEMTKDVRPEAVTPVQYQILEYIAVSQPVTPSQISDCQHMSLPNTSREIKKLCEKRLCEKYADPEDRRKQYVRLTAEGKAMMAKVFQQIEARFRLRLQNAASQDLTDIGHAIDVLQSKVFDPGK